MQKAALYIHIPFCARKCAYCDFASYAGREGDFSRYLAALEGEILAAARRYGRLSVPTIYIGGGTPSILKSDALVHLIAMARALFAVEPDAEITVEANPGTLNPAMLRDLRAAGVNRLSMGMQAAQPHLLDLLGRIHNQADVEQSARWARAALFDNLSLDLMYALPGQTMADWVDTLKAAMALRPEHLSCYSLILEPGTPLALKVESGALETPGEDAALAMQHAAARILARRGYARYEISNYALPGRACRHNEVYWARGDYLGLGLSAHSLMNGERFANTDALDDYLAGAREISREPITAEAAREEAIMLGTRTARGIDLALVAGREQALVRLTALGLIERTADRLRLTDKGLDVHNAVVLELIG
ncbi:radical SAM family heme chaperone HemW [Bacillota bacterium Meth-B3]